MSWERTSRAETRSFGGILNDWASQHGRDTQQSPAFEIGRALFHVRIQALPEILSPDQLQELKIDVVDVVVEGFVHPHSHQTLGRLHGQGCIGGDLGGQGSGPSRQFIVGHNL